jgi:hypothetical protein
MKTIAIFLHGQNGDIMEALSVMRYREELWGDAKIVWYADEANFDLFKYQDIEVRPFPRGFGYPQMVIEENAKLEGTDKPRWEDWLPLVGENNHMVLASKAAYPSLSDIDYGYFPAPHQVPVHRRHNVQYADVSKKVFGVPDHYEWHPVLKFSDVEIAEAESYIAPIRNHKRIFLETFGGSGQSRLSEEMILRAMDICRELWPGCVFIFGSHKFLRDNEIFPGYLSEQSDVLFIKEYTVRQTALIATRCDLMLSVSSGLTVAASCWDLGQPPTLQFCGSRICSTDSIHNGHFELVTADDKPFEFAEKQYYDKLTELLNEYA